MLLCLWAGLGPSPVEAQAAEAPPRSALVIRFLDSATGYAIEPESVSTRAERPNAVEQRLEGWQIGPSGRAALMLERGRHTIAAVAPGYQPMSGEFEMADNNPYVVEFLLDPLVEPIELQPDYLAGLHREDAMLIQGFLADEDSGGPLEGVRVRSAPSGAAARSDARGFFQMYIPLQSETEGQAAPASLLFEKPGYQSQERQHLELWPRGDWTYRIHLTHGQGKETVDERTLRRRAPAPSAPPPASPTVPEPGATAEAVQPADVPGPLSTQPTNSTVRVPRNIRVLKSDNVTIDYVTLSYYTRAVLPSEWIASWANYTGGSNSLSAGAVAIRCYAIAKINNASATSTYDICGTTSCQVYNPANFNSLTDRAVDYTTDWVLLSGTTIASTEYSAENNSLGYTCGDGFTQPTSGCLYDPVCAGEARYGHGRGMCQWGSARWATGQKMAGRKSSDTTPNGYPRRDWMWIVKHYYPTLALVKGAALVVGDDIKALTSTRVYACADGSITSGSGGTTCGLITTKSAGATGTIIGGPVVVTSDGKGFTWYQIQWSDATVGWSAENYIDRVFSLPSAPDGLAAAAAGMNRINITWTDTSSVEAGFSIERAPASGGPWIELSTVGAGVTSYADTNLYAGSTWYYRVRAYNAGGYSDYSSVAGATTAGTPPVLAAIGDKIVTQGATVTFTNTATASELVQLLTDFEPFMSETANGVVMFRTPRYSGSTSSFLDATPDLAAVTDTFPAGGNASGRVLRITCSFTSSSNPWLRLTTSSAATFPNPVIDFTKMLRFSIYADRPIRVTVGCRETSTAPGTAIGSNGGTSGGIEWAGVTGKADTAPVPTRTVPAGSWTTLTFDLPNEPIVNFSSGNGVLAAGLGVLEHIAIVPAAGPGVYNVYLDNLAVVTGKSLSYSLDAGAPANARIDPVTGVFTWTTTNAPVNSTNVVTVRVTDNGTPPLSAARTFTVTVLSKPMLQSPVVANGHLTLSWSAIAGTTYRVQYKNALSEPAWTDLGPEVVATGPTASLTDSLGVNQRFYRILVVGF